MFREQFYYSGALEDFHFDTMGQSRQTTHSGWHLEHTLMLQSE